MKNDEAGNLGQKLCALASADSVAHFSFFEPTIRGVAVPVACIDYIVYSDV